jgi:hypothetical protein
MRWIGGIIGAAALGTFAGWPGALVGVFLGFVLGARLESAPRKRAESRIPPLLPKKPDWPSRPSSAIGLTVSKPVRREEGITIQVVLGRGDSSVDRAPVNRNTKLHWRDPGEQFSCSGVQLAGGMIYTIERPLPWPGEPSAVVLSLSVGAISADCAQDLGYYPQYANLTPEQRRCYLEWLFSGRRDTDPSQRALGYIFLFFYGLERRVLLEGDRKPALLEEITALLEHYGPVHKSRSLRSYALQLLHFSGWQLGPEAYRALWPRLLEFDGERPDQDGLRFVLANLYQQGEPLDWTVAYRLALGHDESRHSTVVARVREKFWELFEQRFKEQFPAGIPLEASKQDALVQYRPASSALLNYRHWGRAEANPFELRLPNVAGLRRQFKALPEIWNSCIEDLSGYSRAISSKRQGQAAALATWQALPAHLRRGQDHPLKHAFEEMLKSGSQEGDYVFIPAGVLGAMLEIEQRPKLTVGHSRQISDLVRGLGWQLAPSPEVTGLPLSWNQELALYPGLPDETVEPRVRGLIRLLYLAVALASAGGVIDHDELQAFHGLIAEHVEQEVDWRPLRATEASLCRDGNAAVRALPQITKLIPAENRAFVLRTMARIAAARKEVSLQELKLLRRVARGFHMAPDAVEGMLREDAFREVAISPPGQNSKGEPIPARPSSTGAGFSLDQDRIKALTAETSEVISMLSLVMAEPEETPNVAPFTAPAEVPVIADSPAWLAGLELRYHSAVLTLVRYDEMTCRDFDALAASCHLLPDDLLNAVNAWADETLGDFLLERAENVRIFRTLLPAGADELATAA